MATNAPPGGPPAVPPAVPPVVPPAATAPVIPVFALGPGRSNNVLDYSTGPDSKIFFKATAPLDEKYDGKADSFNNFLAQVKNKSRLYGWVPILNVADNQGILRDLLTSYGMMSLKNVQAHATANYVGQQSRDMQNSEMMYHFIFDSLTPEFRTKVNLHCHDYTIGTALDGACLLKKVIMLTFIDTRATTAYIRELLVNMPNQIVKFDYNITTFNEWVDTLVTTLSSRGEQANDVLTYLWKTYLSVPDTKFLRYIEGHRDQYLDGSADYTPEGIMHLADNYYKTRFQTDDWRKSSGEQEEIVALNVKIMQLEKKTQSSQKVVTVPNAKKAATTPTIKPNAKTSKATVNTATTASDAAWIKLKPKNSDPQQDGFHIQTVKEKQYFWCPHHGNGQWV
ncbi:hypothetical protein ACA910_005174 [Epithemia clementina (nom. ined.)]